MPEPWRISSNSRRKLNAFRYHETGDDLITEKLPSNELAQPLHDNKENLASWINGVLEPMPSQSATEKPSTLLKERKVLKEAPQTPASRIPLADLISNTEDAFNLAPAPTYTPDDHVIWQHVPVSSNPDAASQTPATRGEKRRRHSTTPNSSPSAPGLKEPRKEPFDMQNIQSLLKTPQTDLAADLWKNYKRKSAINNDSEELPPPHFPNLLSSSPQTPASVRTARDSSGLRRSISCNAEWPSSKAKRRKFGHDLSHQSRGMFSRSRSNVLDSGRPESSRINALLDQIEKSLLKPLPERNDERTGPSSSSPLPTRAGSKKSRSSSPMEEMKHARPTETTNIQSTVRIDTEFAITANDAALEAGSSEFGDEDLDNDFLELAAASMDPFEGPSASWAQQTPSKPYTRRSLAQGSQPPGRTRPVPAAPVPTTVAPVTHVKRAYESFDADDFDEFDSFSDGLEDMMAEFDAKPTSQPAPVIAASDGLGITASALVHRQSAVHPAGENLHDRMENARNVPSSDEFDDDDFDLDVLEEDIAQLAGAGSRESLRSRQAIKRYLVVDTSESSYVTLNGRTQPEQVLSVKEEKTERRKLIVLRESWCDSPCTKDSYIHIIGDFDWTGQCIVDDSHNMIILHPDHLISATVVADSISCQRRAVLQDRIKAIADLGQPQVFGNIFHEAFQEAMKANNWEMDALRKLVEVIILRHIEDLYVIRMSIPEAVEYVMSRMPEVKAWADVFLRAKPAADSVVEDRHSTKLSLSINKLLEVEEHVWSPMYGLKGNIDATVQIACEEEGAEKTLIVPLELKTGKRDTNQAHRAQTALYTLLLSDRYDVDVTFGLLYYLETSRILRIRGVRHELLQMIQVRNRLAGYVRQRYQLPPMIKQPRMCGNCYAKTSCLIYHKLSEDGDVESSGLGEQFAKATNHLTPKHRDFFKKWDELLTKEEQSMMRFRRELWTLVSSERESLGRCFANVVIEPGSAFEDKDGLKINRFRYTLVKKHASPGFSFGDSQITTGEPIVISDEKGHFALANGYVTNVSPKRITVAVDRRLHNARSRSSGFDPKTKQIFRGIMEIGADSDSRGIDTSTSNEPEEEILYRLDKDEFSNGMATVRNNLICMMEKDLFQAERLRKLIVEGDAPVFTPTTPAYTMSDSVRASLNVDQQRAIDKVMSAKDYALVLGMPGTGKTTTIAHIIRALVAQGKNVLLTSYTHTAVDNILLKIRDDHLRILRIGATAKVHPEVQQFADLAAHPKGSIEELKESYEVSQVVATTCLGINHAIFNQRIFDYCIVDEASQITLPVCLGPIRMARTFILVGDHYQLPPLVQNKEAQEGGLDVSLFKLLSDAQPSSVVNLEHQYRMCEDIMVLSNTLIYSDRLKCGTPEVAVRSLEIPNPAGLKQHHISQLPLGSTQRQYCLGTNLGRCWLRDLVDPTAKTRLVNTDTLATPALDTASGSRIVNPTEALLCTQLVEALISCGIPAQEIGVITFYRSQLALLKQQLRHNMPALEMHTADKFQGRDKEIVILSCVRSNADNNVGDLLRDWRRVNVAFTRARTKLLVVGSKTTLRDGNELLSRFVKLVEGRGWVYDLPRNAVESHVFASESLLGSTSPLLDRAADATTLSPSPNSKRKSLHHGGGPGRAKKARQPLSPLQGWQQPRQQTEQSLPAFFGPKGGTRKEPEKRGGMPLSGDRIVGNRPVLQDMVNDILG